MLSQRTVSMDILNLHTASTKMLRCVLCVRCGERPTAACIAFAANWITTELSASGGFSIAGTGSTSFCGAAVAACVSIGGTTHPTLVWVILEVLNVFISLGTLACVKSAVVFLGIRIARLLHTIEVRMAHELAPVR